VAEHKRIEEELPTTELASDYIPSKHPYGPELGKSREWETLDRAAEVPELMPSFSEPEMRRVRSQWSKLQTVFLDGPLGMLEDADKRVTAVMQRLAEGFANERSSLEKQLGRGDHVSAEDLWVALNRYRTFFDC
jgi:hypothetical protein